MLLHGYATLTIDAVWDAFQRVITVVIKTLFGLVETTTFSSKSATVLVASLLLYVVFFDLNRVSSM